MNHAKYFGVISDRGIMWRIHIAFIEVVAFCILRVCCVFRSDWLGVSIKLTLNRAIMRSVMIYACPSWEYVGRHPPAATIASAKQGNVHDWQVFSTLFPANCMCLSRVCSCVILSQNCAGNKLKSWNCENQNVGRTGQDKAQYWDYKRVKLGSCQVYICQVTKLPLQ